MKADRLVVAVFEHNSHLACRLLPSLARTINMPTAAHQHVCGERSASREMDEQPLAAGFNRVYKLAGEWRVVIESRKQRIGGAEPRDSLAGKCTAHRARSSENGIALGHVLLNFL